MRTFELHRIEDETGISGTGIVAEGVVFGDGTCAMRWKTVDRSTATYDDIRALERIHGHNGRTKIVYTGEPFRRGMQDYAQDSCENAPFASVGGLDKRRAMVAPDYITPAERPSYIEGYRIAAMFHLGEDWETCAFGWAPAMTINAPEDRSSQDRGKL